jgi:DEAD/DEAH box helicase domain-containing protein
MSHHASAPHHDAESVLAAAGFAPVEEHTIRARAARHEPVPAALHPRVRAWLSQRFPAGLYRHQARALAALLEGSDVALSTPTASGKTLVFLAYAAHRLLSSHAGARARVLALYPAKALIRDQAGSWTAMLGELGLRSVIIDGSVPVADRTRLLQGADVVLMTPDAAHAWLLRTAGQKTQRGFLAGLALLVLDEAHSYDGAFGTNTAHLLRRLRAIAAPHQTLSSTATIADTSRFVESLTGAGARCIDAEDDGSEAPEKRVVVARSVDDEPSHDRGAALVRELASGALGRFLVFADSRKRVEMTVRAIRGRADERDHDDADPVSELGIGSDAGVLPYRAGYEEADRKAIQDALVRGKLRGVVATSALELGIDIGDIECVALLSPPPSMKSFWQRFGRAGRRSIAGLCLLVDDAGVVARAGGLRTWLARPIEPSRLYLDNRYIQYAHALCAAAEITALGRGTVDLEAFATLPAEFRAHVENELEPRRPVPTDLYPLKQRGTQPHFEFPLRRATDRSFVVEVRGSQERKGELTHAQMLREAYPGAVYYYMARAFRVQHVNERKGLCECVPTGGPVTRPNAQTIVFPRFVQSTLQLARGPEGFLCESELQVSERVLGFTEIRGKTRVGHDYGPESPWSQKPLTRYFETSGVCWWLRKGGASSERVAEWIRSAFCHHFGVQEQDVGVGGFHSNGGPLGEAGLFRGACVYDATNGSLRLTSLLAANFREIVAAAADTARDAGAPTDEAELRRLYDAAGSLEPADVDASAPLPDPTMSVSAEAGPVEVVAPGQPALYVGGAIPEEITVLDVRYTPRGIFYAVEPPTKDSKRLVAAACVIAIPGRTRMARFDLDIGELLPEAAE